MTVPSVIRERLSTLGTECGTELHVVRHWENEFRAGWYCRFRGVAVRSDFLLIELAGILSVELDADWCDSVDMFVFINGTRVSNWNPPKSFKYLCRSGSESFRWDDLDEGFEQFDSLENDGWRIVQD